MWVRLPIVLKKGTEVIKVVLKTRIKENPPPYQNLYGKRKIKR